MGSGHFPIQISTDKPPKQNITLAELRHQFDNPENYLFHNSLNNSLNSIDTNLATQGELEELAVTLCDKLMKAVNERIHT